MRVEAVAGAAPAMRAQTARQVADEFADALGAAIERLGAMQTTADQRVEAFMARGEGELHQVALAVEEAALALQFALQVRNKAVEAYQELMRMQI